MIRNLNILKSYINMSTFAKVPEVDIEPTGVFKYILIKLTAPSKQDSEPDKILVRGYAECNYHVDINDLVTQDLQKKKEKGEISEWSTKVLGGGRIIHDSPNKTIKVYGYSQAYGKADHAKTVSLLKKVYDDYDISWSDEGY